MRETMFMSLLLVLTLLTSCGSLLAVDMIGDGDGLRGSIFAQSLTGLTLEDREQLIWQEVEKGSVPKFYSDFVTVENEESIDAANVKVQFQVSPEYFSIGRNDDYFLCPITPGLAQRIADRWDCILPTRKMVDLIYQAAPVKLAPSFLPPDDRMVTVPAFIEHNETVWDQRQQHLSEHPLGTLAGGHKKDVVITDKLHETSLAKVAIYGWHQLNGQPIQPLYTGHSDQWVDYSHGVRLVKKIVLVNGEEMDIAEVLEHPKWHALLSDEGAVEHDRYPER